MSKNKKKQRHFRINLTVKSFQASEQKEEFCRAFVDSFGWARYLNLKRAGSFTPKDTEEFFWFLHKAGYNARDSDEVFCFTRHVDRLVIKEMLPEIYDVFVEDDDKNHGKLC